METIPNRDQAAGGANLADVAREAGVGLATASRALGDRAGVKPATRDKVRQAAEKLGYIPRPALAALVGMRNRGAKSAGEPGSLVSGVLVTRHRGRHHSFEKDAVELCELGKPMGYECRWTDTYRYHSAAQMGRELYAQGVNFVILFRIIDDPEWLRDFPWERFVVVSLDPALDLAPMCVVRPSQFREVFQALEIIHARGYRRIGAILSKTARVRLENLRRLAAAREFQRALPPEDRLPVYEFDPTSQSPFPDARQWLSEHRPDALFCLNSGTAQDFREAAGCPDLPAAVHSGAREDGFSGYTGNRGAFREALTRVDLLTRAGRYGLPPERYEVVVNPPWIEGRTLPDLFGPRT